MKKILILLISTAVCGAVYSADDVFNKDKSLLMLNNDESHYELESSEHVDFFESYKQQEQNLIDQRNHVLEKHQQIQSSTSNMSPHDKAQYYLEHRHFDVLNSLGNEQQFNSIQKAKNNGLISKKDYQQRIANHNSFPVERGSNQLKLSIPIGE